MDLYNPYMVPTLFPRGILIFQGVPNKIKFFDKISCSGNMNTKAFFPHWGGSNLILGIVWENQIFFLRTSATIRFFHQILIK